jgi:RND family efflux transporter MFP subunit
VRWVLPVLLVAALACGRGGSGGAGGAPDPTTPVRVAPVAPREASPAVVATGVLVAERMVTLRTEVAGLVAAVAFDHGERVEAGRILVRLQDAEARAAVSEALAQATLADAELARARSLAERQNASRADVERAEAEASLAAARVARAREGLRRTAVAAPFSGVLGLRSVVKGDWVQPGHEITTLVDPGSIAVDVAVAERELPLLSVGMEAEIAVDALPGRTFSGRVSFLPPALDPASRTGAVRVAIAEVDAALRPGATARVTLQGRSAPALRVPTQAVLTSAKGPAVYVVGADGKAELRPVVTADRDVDSLRIVEGLAPGDRVIVDGLVRLRPGAPVRVLGELAP